MRIENRREVGKVLRGLPKSALHKHTYIECMYVCINFAHKGSGMFTTCNIDP